MSIKKYTRILFVFSRMYRNTVMFLFSNWSQRVWRALGRKQRPTGRRRDDLTTGCEAGTRRAAGLKSNRMHTITFTSNELSNINSEIGRGPTHLIVFIRK